MVRTLAGRSASGHPAVAIVHDYLTQRGGAERVVALMVEAFPHAPLLTSLYSPEDTFREFRQADITTTSLNRVALLRRHHRLALPLLAPTFSAQRVDAEITLCSSSGWAHGVRTNGRKVVYCYAPARWLYQTDRYLGSKRDRRGTWVLKETVRVALKGAKPALARWDKRAAASADCYLTSSRAVAAAIKSTYGIEADVVPPPPGLQRHGPEKEVVGLERGYALCVSRLLPYKNVQHIVRAAASLPSTRLVLVGDGPLRRALEASATRNVLFLGDVDDAQLRWLYRNARVLVSAAYEDFGLTPLEAATFGVPTVALEAGGFLDTVSPGVNGLFFSRPTAEEIAAALTESQNVKWAADEICSHAHKFSKERFIARLQRAVYGALALPS